MRSRSSLRLAALAAFVLAATAIACGSIDLAYTGTANGDGGTSSGGGGDGGTNGGDGGTPTGPRIIRDSSFDAPIVMPTILDPSDAGTCNPDEEDGGGCDLNAGLGCCFGPNGPHCIYQWEINEPKFACKIFVGCRQDDQEGNECCWNTNDAGVMYSAFSVSCANGGRTRACIDTTVNSNPMTTVACPNDAPCGTDFCAVDGGSWQIGICGGTITCP